MCKEKRLKNLKAELEKSSWPAVYLFKFIVPSDRERLRQVLAIFETGNASVTTKKSSKGKYISVSAKEQMTDVESIIRKYEQAFKIEELIAL